MTPQSHRLAAVGFEHASKGDTAGQESWYAAPGITKHASPAAKAAVRNSLAGLMPAHSDSAHLKSGVEIRISQLLWQVFRASDSIGSLYALLPRSIPFRYMDSFRQPTDGPAADFIRRK